MKTEQILKTIGLHRVFEHIENDIFLQPQRSILLLRTCKNEYHTHYTFHEALKVVLIDKWRFKSDFTIHGHNVL